MPEQTDYDVVVIGGAFSGAAAAILLRRDAPQLRVLVIERSTRFDEKVGEATTEMSAMFITRRLAMWHHLEAEHLPKEGLRYWFSNSRVTSHGNASESGGMLRSAVPSFQLKRDVFDEYLLKTAVDEGIELARPARVLDISLGDFRHEVKFEDSNGTQRSVSCRWVLDASGRAGLIGRKLGLIERVEEHPTAAIWARWKNVRHIDDLVARRYPHVAGRNVGSRRLGTNHYVGYGYWIWVIPLGSGETSIGVVFDKRIVELDRSRNREADYVQFLRAIPALAELLEEATLRSDDLRFYSHLPYVSKQYMGNGWALLGDAAAFLDPYYSPGLDHAAFSVEATVRLVTKEAAGEEIAADVELHNEAFARSYRRFLDSIYIDKYVYMGEHDLLTASMLLDTAHYYLFVVMPAYRIMKKFFWMPVLGPKEAFFSYHLIRLYSRRFAKLARLRIETREAGRRNDGRRISAYFDLSFAPVRMIARGLKLWAFAEADGLRLAVKKLFSRKKPLAEPRAKEAPGPSA